MTIVSATVLDLVVRVSLLFAAAAVLSVLLRRSAAAARHLVWTLAIAGSLALPVVTFVTPRLDVALLPAAMSAVAPLADAMTQSGSTSGAAETAMRQKLRRSSATSASNASRPPASDVASFGFWRLALIVWAVGFVAVILRLAFGTARMSWIARRARPLTNGTGLRLAERLSTALGVRERVIFLEGERLAMPMTWGVLRPRVMLPEAASEWPVARQRVVLLHELAHVKRRDCLTQLLAQAACAVYWFNPLAWLAARRLRAEREHACDDLVLAAGTRGSDYADHLLEIARSMRSAALPTWAAVAMAHRSQLEGRLMAILDPELPRRFPTRRRSVMLAASFALIATPIALITPVSRAAEAVTIIESGTLESQGLPTPTPTPMPTPAPVVAPTVASVAAPAAVAAAEPVLSGGAAARVAAQAASAAFYATAREWLGPAAEGALVGIREGVAEGIAEAAEQGVPGGVGGGVGGGVAGSPASGRRDPRAVAALVAALKDSDKEVREHAMQALAGMKAPEALDAIRAALKDANASVREQAAFALGQYRDRASVEALGVALKDQSADVREQAVFALGQIRDERAAEGIAGALKDADADVREQAAFALGQLRHAGSVDALAAALKDASASVREQAAFALGQIRDRRAVDPLVGALRDESASVREQAVFALGQIGDARAIDALTGALKDANVEVRRQAAFALGQLGK